MKLLNYAREMMQKLGLFVDRFTLVPLGPERAHGRVLHQNLSDQRLSLYRGTEWLRDRSDFLFMITAKLRRFLEQAIKLQGVPIKISSDKGGANAAAIEYCN